MKNFTDEQILACLLGDSDRKNEIELLKTESDEFRNRVESLKKLMGQLKVLPFHLETTPQPQTRFRLAPVLAIALAFMAGIATHSFVSKPHSADSVTFVQDHSTELQPKNSLSSLGSQPKTIM